MSDTATEKLPPWHGLDDKQMSCLVNLRMTNKEKAMYAYLGDTNAVKSGHAFLRERLIPALTEAAEKVWEAEQKGWKSPI
jgi:hypothetical protein